ncbi:putative disease resistance protein RGA1 [Trifolium pratense]|uniref:putative disease resistance protein RGA1 n=1 Tax=Trifolium pratense TaxID=57577 RepID=UPI001E692C64|nr:putative disease resistance protein RGA1 [Trifolium pratense]
MAEKIPYGVATTLINRLASAAIREFGRINGVMDELERLKNTVESIRAVLLDAEEKQEQSHAVQNWVRRLKDVLIPADDLLDEFLIQDMIQKRDEPHHQNKVKKVLNPFSPNKFAFRHNMANEIEKIQKMFDDVVRDMYVLILNSNVVVVEKPNNEWRETSSYVLESNIIGRDDDKEKIVNLLRQSHGDQNVSLVAIVGMGGLGKTTLAQLVYSDDQVQNLFDKSMWVCVSDNFDVKTIVKNMLESLTKKKIDDTLSLDTLQNMLGGNLSGKRYLLVLDDIWNDSFEKWDKLWTGLMCGAQGSKVIVTTRSRTVAQTMGVCVPYALNGLILEDSWSLLKNIAFRDDTTGVNRTLESTGKKIAEKCRGVPLAIRSLGGILKNKREENEWGHVLRGDFWKLCEEKDSIMPVLKLSYRNLSPQQKQCFSYCSLYPKDWEFKKGELIQMWMAHGYLECSVEGQCMEDVGNQFVNIFLMKSFFQDAKLNEDGDINCFKMHDLMHDLATQVAGNDCCYLDNKAKKIIGRPVHVSVESDAVCLLESLDASRLRTLIMFTSYGQKICHEDDLTIISTFKYLRVLKLKYLFLSKLFGYIGKLKHLRYLHLLECGGLESGSKSIGNLFCLQTIKVSLGIGAEVVLSTQVISKLINLRHLEINTQTFKDEQPVRFGKLSIHHHKGVTFSKWISPLTNIVEISLSYCKAFRYLPPVERLPFLKSLKLRCINYLEYIYYEEPILHESFFPSLESLHIYKCDKLRGWKRMGDDLNDINSSHHLLLPQFPCLSKLAVRECRMLTCMPTFPNIKSLSLNYCSVEILQATLCSAASQYSIGCTPLSMLKSLRINETIVDMKNVPQDWLKNCTSLENLEFDDLSSQYFQVIEIWFKDDLIRFSSLQKITFQFCMDLKALPDWICNILSLQHIKIDNCTDLVLLPKGMHRLTNLRTLEIIVCPLLGEACRTETSATWPKIAQIPNIIIKSD